MTSFDRGISRRRFLGTGTALIGGLALAPSGALGAPGAGVRYSRAAGQGRQFEGQVVIAIKQNPNEEAKQALSDAYRAVQPGVEIIWETQDIEPVDYTSLLGTQFAAGDIRLDVVSSNYLPTFQGYVNFDRYRTSENPYTGLPWDEDLDWDSIGTNAAGERELLITRAAHMGWFYNQDLFEQAGVQPPTTWSEFVEVCATLQAAGITPIVANYQWQVPQWISEIYWDQYNINWVETIRAQPGDWNHDPERDGSFVFDPTNPNLHNAFTYNVQRFWQAIRDGVIRVDTAEVAEITRNMAAVFPRYATADFFVIGDPYPAFLQQQAAMMPDGSYTLNTLKQDLESLSPDRLDELGIDSSGVNTFAWSIFQNPPMEGELVKSPVRSVEGGSGEYVSIVDKSQEQTDLVVDFVRFWLSPAGYEPYLAAQIESAGFSPSGPPKIRGIEDPPEVAALFDLMPAMGNAERDYYQIWTSGQSGDAVTRQDLRGLFQRVLEEEITPEEYAQQLQQYFTDNLDRFVELAGLTLADIDNPARQPGT
ncbi:MAG: ABC transporter substrate-binding protein [Thermomicrobiales bacterium]